jgi:phi13 family phage major tail protein
MAVIGVKYPIASKIESESNTLAPNYGTGFVIAQAIAVKIEISGGDSNQLFADDAIVESDTAFEGGKIDIGIDDLPDQIYADILGHAISTNGGTTVVTANVNDIAPYVGIGFYKTRRKSGIASYRSTWLYKTQFSEPSDEAKAKGKTIEWQTPSISGNIMALTNGDWKKQATFASETDAKAWIENLANIGQPTTKTALAAKIAVINALDPEDYTSVSYANLYYSLQIAIAVNTNTDATQTQVDAALADLTTKQGNLVSV